MEKEQYNELNVNNVEIALLKKKLIDIAGYKLLYTVISSVFTVFATLYTKEFGIIILSTIIFVTPFFIESLEKSDGNNIEKFFLYIYRITYMVLTFVLFIVLIWSFFNSDDAYHYSKWFIYNIIYISIGLCFVYSVCSYFYTRSDDKLPLALSTVREKSIENKNNMNNFEDDMKEAHKENHRNFIKEKSVKPNQGGRKK